MPNTAPDIVLTPVDTAVLIDPLANDSGEGLVLEGFTQPAHGTLVVNADATLTYTPAPGFVGVDGFTYTVRDATGATATGSVTISVLAPNQPPVANDDAATTTDAAVEIPVLANDNDPDGDPLRLVAIGQPVHGTASFVAPNRIRYLPQPGFSGIDRFTYTIDDGQDGIATGTVTVRVEGANRAPVAVPLTAETTEGTPLVLDLLAHASDPDGDPLRLEALAVPQHGRLTVNADRTVTYTPEPGWSGVDSFSWTVGDGRGGLATGTVQVRVVRPNLPPAANDDRLTTPQDTPLTFDPLANDSDPDGDPLRLVAFGLPRHGRLALGSDGRLTYTPDPRFSGEDSFTYTIDDGRGGTVTGTVRITVTPAEPPVEVFANGFRFRRRILLPARQQASEVIEGFVLLVKEEGGWLKSVTNGGQVESPDGFDIRFELEDGTKLPHEIERYDPVAGRLVAWVRIPQWDIATPLTLFLYYGKAGLTATEADPAATWQDYLAVWDPITGRDRSGNGRHLVASGVVPDELVGPAGRFDGTALATLADPSFLAGRDQLSVVAVVRADAAAVGSSRGILTQGTIDGDSQTSGLTLQFFRETSSGVPNVLHFKVATSAGNAYVLTTADTQRAGPQVLHALWQRNSAPELWRDGERLRSSAERAADGSAVVVSGPLQVGTGALGTPEGGWIGAIGELWLRAWRPGAARIALEARAVLVPELFYGIGDGEGVRDPAPSPVALPLEAETRPGEWVDLLPPEDGTLAIVDAPAQGIVTIVSGKIRYTPAAGFIGEEQFRYALVGADGRRSTALCRVRVGYIGHNEPRIPEPPAPKRLIDVANTSQLAAALAAAVPGDRIRLAPGTYSGFTMTRSGTAADPIVITWQGRQMPVVNGPVTVDANHVWLHRLDVAGSGARIRLFGHHNKVVRCKLHGYRTPAGASAGGIAFAVAGDDHEIAACDIYDIDGRGISCENTGVKALRPHIHHNWIHDHVEKDNPPSREALQLGQTQMPDGSPTLYSMQALVEYNLFENWNRKPDAENETISVKCSDNIIRFNTFRNVRLLNLRFGKNNRVEANWFEQPVVADNGIGVRGDDHVLIGNRFSDWPNGSAILIRAGTQTQDLSNGPAAPGTTPWDGHLDAPIARRVKLIGNSIAGNGFAAVGKPDNGDLETLPAQQTRFEAHSGRIITKHDYGWQTGTNSGYREVNTSQAPIPSEPVPEAIRLTSARVGVEAVIPDGGNS